MLKTLHTIKIAALFFILSGFAGPSSNPEIQQVLKTLNFESNSLVSMLTLNKNSLASDSRSLMEQFKSLQDALTSGRISQLTRTDICSLWLQYGELFRRAAQQTNFEVLGTKRILLSMRGHMNKLLKSQ